MSCRKRFLFIPSLCLFFSLFFSFLLEKNSFAASISFSVDSSTSINTILCDSQCLSPYNYAVFRFTDSSNLSSNSLVTFSIFPYNMQFALPTYVDYYLIPLNSSVSSIRFISTTNIGSSFSAEVLLSDTIPDFISPSVPTPSGTLSISSNGQYDVTQYEYVDVNVENEVIQGDYHDDLVSIKHAIITCGGVILVLYFFYCIYRMIIKNSGVH